MALALAPKLCISVKLKNLKANHNVVGNQVSAIELCISVKLKNLKANHNFLHAAKILVIVVYIRKVKKSESKSQHAQAFSPFTNCCVYP